jgi:DNA-binding transcriptional LysR family regulator
VIAGLGVAMLPIFLAGPAMERGEVVTLLRDYAIPEAGLYIVRPPPAEPVPNKVRALTDIVLEKFGPGSDWDAYEARCSARVRSRA